MKYDMDVVRSWMIRIAEKAEENIVLLAELDGLSGDGDLGETIGKIAGEMKNKAGEEAQDIGELLKMTASAMNKAAPSTLGTLLSVGTMALAKYCKNKPYLTDEETARLPRVFADAIQSKGKAELGDKTILDSLIPLANVTEETYKETRNLKAAYSAGAGVAVSGAESTRGMIPKAGRAQWIGERVKDNLDGGAVLCAKISETFL